MRVLVTGADGFVGSYVSAWLKKNSPWEVEEATRLDFANDFANCSPADVIINFAARSSVDESFEDPQGYVRDNMEAQLRILKKTAAWSTALFIQFSTVEVYDVTNMYAGSKAAQEKIVEAYSKTFDLPAVIVRSSNIVGPEQRAGKFVPTIIEKVKSQEVVPIYKPHSEGTAASRVYVPAVNVAHALKFLVEKYTGGDMDWHRDNEWDIDGGERLTNLEMAKLIAKVLDKKLHYEYVDPETRPVYATRLVAEGKRLTTAGWKPPWTLRGSLTWLQK